MERFGQDSVKFNQDYLDSQKRAKTFNEDRRREEEESIKKKLRQDAEEVEKELAKKKRIEDEKRARLAAEKRNEGEDEPKKVKSQKEMAEEIMEERIASGVDQIERKEMSRSGEKK
jgi:hypothetical protein